jgi:hypothetical protein
LTGEFRGAGLHFASVVKQSGRLPAHKLARGVSEQPFGAGVKNPDEAVQIYRNDTNLRRGRENALQTRMGFAFPFFCSHAFGYILNEDIVPVESALRIALPCVTSNKRPNFSNTSFKERT